MYSCRLYFNTGFNSNNIPDSPSLLDRCDYKDVSSLDIMQDRFLSEIRVKARWNEVKDCDYCVLYTESSRWAYSVDAISMAATDVAILSVTQDFINSVGGVTNLKILDGITDRVHVTSDNYGEYTAEDELLTPNEPLKLRQTWYSPSTASHTYVSSTIDINKQSLASSSKTYTEKGETGDEIAVTVPKIQPADSARYCKFKFADAEAPVDFQNIFDMNDDFTPVSGAKSARDSLLEGICNMRSLGVDNAITNQVSIPDDYHGSVTEHITQADAKTDYGFSYVRELSGTAKSVDTQIAYKIADVKNNRINYSGFAKFGLISCSGESCEFDPADIYDSASETAKVSILTDPRLTGKPYFRYTKYLSDESTIGFFKNCISGMQWKQVPLVFTGASGNALNTMRYEANKEISTQNYRYDALDRGVELGKGVGSLIGAGLTGNVSAAVSASMDVAQSGLGIVNKAITTDLQRKSELLNLQIANTVVAPQINFPFNTEMMRDFFGNGVLAYRYTYSQNDLNRIDKLLTMYGYKYAKPLEKSDFNNRKYFNFVSCQNATFGGNAKWINDGLAEQLRSGVRVWHVLPDISKYTDNPVKGE